MSEFKHWLRVDIPRGRMQREPRLPSHSVYKAAARSVHRIAERSIHAAHLAFQLRRGRLDWVRGLSRHGHHGVNRHRLVGDEVVLLPAKQGLIGHLQSLALWDTSCAGSLYSHDRCMFTARPPTPGGAAAGVVTQAVAHLRHRGGVEFVGTSRRTLQGELLRVRDHLRLVRLVLCPHPGSNLISVS